MTISERATSTKNKRRSERVLLSVPIKLSVETPNGMTATEDGKTQVVNLHGGLLVTRLHVDDGEQFILTNAKTGATRRCSVIQADLTGSHEWSIAFQFVEPAPNFWPVAFQPQDWADLES
jgi:hypothetical protein